MTIIKNIILSLFVVALMFIFCNRVKAATFIAYSLNVAEGRIKKSKVPDSHVTRLGGITNPIAMVYDKSKQDLILIGQVVKERQELTLDDFVTALRSMLIYGTCPLVSIDKTVDTPETKKQIISFGGGIKNTQFGMDLLEADVLLKKIGLGKVNANIWGVSGYSDMYASHWAETGKENSSESRFWFVPDKESTVATRQGVAVVKNLKVNVETEQISNSINTSKLSDPISVEFAFAMTTAYADISMEFLQLRRLNSLFKLAGIADGICNLSEIDKSFNPNLNFWLKDYHVLEVETPEYYPLLETKKILHKGGRAITQTIDGGVKLKALMSDLSDGVASALREIVILARPDGNPLTWEVPLQGWDVPDIVDTEITSRADSVEHSLTNSRKIGTPLGVKYNPFGQVDLAGVSNNNFPLLTNVNSTHRFKVANNFANISPVLSPQIGGVILSGVASIEGTGQAKVDLSGGNFAFIVDGKNARLSPEVFRKFITALWTVYYSNQDPGISIDPIAPGVDKHLVRYIGKVMNTDLGKVMRDADYLMKKWAVGTDRPDIKGFKNPDEYAAEKRKMYLAASRFWFVPEDMQFKRSDDTLLFDDGRMTIQTEYLTTSAKKSASPSNEKFAEFFTKYYTDISEKYPVYKELFEYAKMVSLAKYLKEQGIPLFWFLMANKDLVITEDSPGTVDELVKTSDYFRDITISGGVNLDFDTEDQGHYVYDQVAVEAINEARSKHPSEAESSTSITSDRKISQLGPDPFSFELGKESYTVVPQHSLTSGKDRRGIRYQTDMAVRGRGLQLTQQSLDILKADLVYRETMEEMEPVLKTMHEHELDQEEMYALYEEKKKKAEKRIDGILKGLDKIKNKKYSDKDKFVNALEECIGIEQTAKWKPMISKVAYYDTKLELVRYFNPKSNVEGRSGEFGNGWNLLVPFRIKVASKTKKEFLNVMIPEKMALVNLLTGEEEILTFSTDRYSSAGYVPEKLENSQVVGLFLMTDLSYRLADKLGNEFWFNPGGYLTDMVFSKDHHIRYEYLDGFTDTFEQQPYSIKPKGNDRVVFLNVSLPKRMELEDHIHERKETLTFSEKGEMAGYVPEDIENSRFKIMVLMSNASFRLIDKNGNETALTSTGKFEKMAVADERPMVSAISQGSQKIAFKYTLDSSGNILIASANLLENEEDDIPTFVVKYEYDTDGRLADITKINNKMVSKQEHHNAAQFASN